MIECTCYAVVLCVLNDLLKFDYIDTQNKKKNGSGCVKSTCQYCYCYLTDNQLDVVQNFYFHFDFTRTEMINMNSLGP